MKNKIIDLLKGILIGIAVIIPGFSGGAMAVILRTYERLIENVGTIFSDTKQVLKRMWAMFLGMIIGVVASIFLISSLLENFPVPTSLFFVGLVIGSVPNIFKNYQNSGKSKPIDLVVLLISMAIIVIIPLSGNKQIDLTNIDIWSILLMFGLGVISSSAMLVPGGSGSLILMAFGYYSYMMKTIGDFIKKVVAFEFNGLGGSFFIILSFGIGVIIGVVLVSRLLTYLLKTKPRLVYISMFGLLVASPFTIIYTVIKEYNDIIINSKPISYVIGVLCLLIGAFISVLPSLKRKEDVNEKND